MMYRSCMYSLSGGQKPVEAVLQYKNLRNKSGGSVGVGSQTMTIIQIMQNERNIKFKVHPISIFQFESVKT